MRTNNGYQESDFSRIVSQLANIREDVDAMDHHQSDRILREIDEVIDKMTNINVSAA